MLGDFEIGAVISQAIEHIGGLMRRGRDHVDMVGGALIGDMRVEAAAVVDAVARVDVTARGTALRSEEHTSELQSLMTTRFAALPLNTKKYDWRTATATSTAHIYFDCQ